MLTYCHVSVGLDVANIAINLVRRFDFNVTLQKNFVVVLTAY